MDTISSTVIDVFHHNLIPHSDRLDLRELDGRAPSRSLQQRLQSYPSWRIVQCEREADTEGRNLEGVKIIANEAGAKLGDSISDVTRTKGSSKSLGPLSNIALNGGNHETVLIR